ncbi:MAG TPA: hypothetical protein VM690_07105, partial [Gaiellaceae bacterium]|nr:hypothetical protein [Gaiellaceae bacterium]
MPRPDHLEGRLAERHRHSLAGGELEAESEAGLIEADDSDRPTVRRPPGRAPAKGEHARSLVPEQADFLAPLAGEEVDAVDEAHPVAAR